MSGCRRQSIRQGTAMRNVIGIFCLLLPALAIADRPHFDDSFSFALGGISHEAEATFSSTKVGEPVTKLSLNDLGMDDSLSMEA